MKKNCPNRKCPEFNRSSNTIKNRHYKRRDDSRKIQCFKCKVCKKKFSAATGTLTYGMHRRRVNDHLFKLISCGVSMRKAAIICNISRGTVASRIKYFEKKYSNKSTFKPIRR